MDEFLGKSGGIGGVRLRIANQELLDITGTECALCGDPMGFRSHVSGLQIAGKVLAFHMDCFDELERRVNVEFPGRASTSKKGSK